jgi:hypothetical protein
MPLIQPLNYCAHAIEDLRVFAGSLRGLAPQSAHAVGRLIDMLGDSVKFLLPNCCIGTDLPSAPAEQNSLWYKLYRWVDGDVPVAEAHRSYLLFRDMTAMSALLLLLVPSALYLSGAREASLLIAAALFGGQYLATAVAARNSGVRFVTNVLAVHATRKVPTTKPAGGAAR